VSIVAVTMVGAMVPAAAATAARLTPLVTLAPGGPFSSGELIDVAVAPNRSLDHGVSLSIEECSAPSNHSPHWDPVCDPRTRQHGRVTARRDGSLLYPGYPIYALPDAPTLHESTHHRPAVCDLTHACVLVIAGGLTDGDGDHDSDDAGGRVWSSPFFVDSAGTDPPPNTPEVPYVLALPLLAAAIIGGTVLVRRRRSGGPSPG